MKKLLVLCMSMCIGLFSLVSCNDDDSPQIPDGSVLDSKDVPEVIMSAFQKQYPGATRVTWMKKKGYAVATFAKEGEQKAGNDAWYEWNSAKWGMSKYEIYYTMLPDSVKIAFEGSEYAKAPWVRDEEIDVLERNDSETLYIIEVEKEMKGEDIEMELYYSEDGILVKKIVDTDKEDDYYEFLPQIPSGSIESWLAKEFPNARIVDLDVEANGTEVEIIADGFKHEIRFDASSNWLETKTKYELWQLAQVPDVVLNAARNQYPKARITEVEKYVTKSHGEYYCVEMENQFDDDFEVYVNLQGEIIERPAPEVGSAVDVDAQISNFINAHYVGATIIERDYDDGYLEITIHHEGIEKEVYFNGRKEWVRSSWEIMENQLPAPVKETLKKQYPDYRIEDIEVNETAKYLHYEVELESLRGEVKAILDKNGKVISQIRD